MNTQLRFPNFNATILAILLLTCSLPLTAQTKTEVLTNQSVIALLKADLDKSIILATINAANAKFDLTTAGIINLKKQGVTTDLINAMIAKSSGKAQTPTNTSVTTEPVASFNKLDPGIYVAAENDKYTQLEPTVFTSSKSGSFLGTALTYGIAKTKSKAVLSGPNANLQLPGNSPVFFFVFPKNGGGNIGNEGNQNSWVSSATSPNEFMLIKLNSVNTSRSKSREVVTGSFGTYSGFSSGIPEDKKVVFKFEKQSSGVYKVFFETPLIPGEYAFIHAGGSATAAGGAPAQKAFDFSIK